MNKNNFESNYISYLAHMLDESFCNEAVFKDLMQTDKNLISDDIVKPKRKSKITPNDLKKMPLEDAIKNKIDVDLWRAAQFAFPEEDKHGSLGGCTINEMNHAGQTKINGVNSGYLKSYFVKGFYEDGTDFNIGPFGTRKVATYYIQLHQISVKKKEWDKFKAQMDSFEQQLAKNIDMQNVSSQNDDLVKFKLAKFIDRFTVVNVAKLIDGYFLVKANSNQKLGPFTSQNIAQHYANEHHYDKPGTAFEVIEKDGKFHVYAKFWNAPKQRIVYRDTKQDFPTEEEAMKAALDAGYQTELKFKDSGQDTVAHIVYPIFIFEYQMAGIDCMDIVIAETKKSAMKLFATQWRSFDGSRVIRNEFSDESELERELMLLRIKDINVFEIEKSQLNEYIDMQEEIMNPLSNPRLKNRQRNKNCQYILGPDMKSGRVPVTLRQDFERRKKDNLSQKRVKPDAKF